MDFHCATVSLSSVQYPKLFNRVQPNIKCISIIRYALIDKMSIVLGPVHYVSLLLAKNVSFVCYIILSLRGSGQGTNHYCHLMDCV